MMLERTERERPQKNITYLPPAHSGLHCRKGAHEHAVWTELNRGYWTLVSVVHTPTRHGPEAVHDQLTLHRSNDQFLELGVEGRHR